jgi:hypothetical protein
MQQLIKNWPYKTERRAYEMPMYFASFTNSWVSLYICKFLLSHFQRSLAHKIVSKAFYDHINVGFFEVIRRTTKAPFVLGFYTGGISTLMLWQGFVKTPMMNEEDPCAPCLLAGSYFSMAMGGIALPMMTIPWIVHYMVTLLIYLFIRLVLWLDN